MLCALRWGPGVASRAHYTRLCGATLCLYSEKSLDEEEVWELLLTQFCTLPHLQTLNRFRFCLGCRRGLLLCNRGQTYCE